MATRLCTFLLLFLTLAIEKTYVLAEPPNYGRHFPHETQGSHSGQEIRGVFDVVEVPPAFSDLPPERAPAPREDNRRQDTPLPNCGSPECPVCINGQCFNNDRTPIRRRPVANTQVCRNGRCRPCQGSECTISDSSPAEFSVGSGQNLDSSSSQIRIGKVGPYGQPMPGGAPPPQYYGKKSKSKKSKGPAPATFPCVNGKCSTCIGSKCYPRSYASIRIAVHGHCPPAACETDCTGFITFTDNCWICSCSGFATREPCMDQSECPSHGSCRNYLCHYAPVQPQVQPSCQFAYQCPINDNCQSGHCAAMGSGWTHIESRTCAYDYHCPTNYFCRESTCWTDHRPAAPVKKQSTAVAPYQVQRPCAFHFQCPTLFICQQTRCMDSAVPHGTSQCSGDTQCRSGEYCIDRTCIPSRNVGRVQSQQTYRCEYLPCHNPVNY